ncbi:MAG: hypothetical protein V1929_08240 [bacterium]
MMDRETRLAVETAVAARDAARLARHNILMLHDAPVDMRRAVKPLSDAADRLDRYITHEISVNA